MTVNAIVAIDEQYGIGKDNDMPWPRIKEDMMWFRLNTTDHVVVMGRKTWESIGSKPLPNRINVVVSSQEIGDSLNNVVRPHWIMEGKMDKILHDLEKMYPDKTIWVIGGSDVYKQALPYCTTVYLTHIPGEFECDTFLDRELIDQFSNQIFIAPSATSELIFEVVAKSL